MPKHDIDTLRHSMAHLMAQALTRLYPNEKVGFGVGPVIEHGFYYDVDMEYRLCDNDLLALEKKMHEIIKENLTIEKINYTREEALEFFKQQEQDLKVQLIEGFPHSLEITCFKQGEFIDLCRGPHVASTGLLPSSFKLLHIAGAYWKGDSNNKMLQRIYAAAFADKKQLKQHLFFLAEAKKRDHRLLGKELQLFHFETVAPGSPFFMPKGAFIYNELIEFMRRIYRQYDYHEVITPQILDTTLWHTSGHYEHYKENMYFTKNEKQDFALKPMNCPCHMLMFKHYKYSYRDLPLRYADFGRLHRYEKSGTLAGLTRVRTFCQDDAHIFTPLSNIQEEISKLLEMFFICYRHFNFGHIKINLSTRPEKKAGSDESWNRAEEALQMALEKSGKEFSIKAGDGAFYGPKIDVEIADALHRYHQLGTIQLDFLLPERFDLKFTNHLGEVERPVVIHRALLGSLERFFAVYLEHIAGAYPFWLAPEQGVIVPVNSEAHLTFCRQLQKAFKNLGYRISIDERNESMGFKTRQIQKAKIPFMLVIGDREMATESINMRKYGEKSSKTMSIDEVKILFKDLSHEKIPIEFRGDQ